MGWFANGNVAAEVQSNDDLLLQIPRTLCFIAYEKVFELLDCDDKLNTSYSTTSIKIDRRRLSGCELMMPTARVIQVPRQCK